MVDLQERRRELSSVVIFKMCTQMSSLPPRPPVTLHCEWRCPWLHTWDGQWNAGMSLQRFCMRACLEIGTLLAAAETWNVETLRSETWCPKRKPRNVTPYRSENDISGFQHVETWEPLSWALLSPPPPKIWAPPAKRGHFRGFVDRNPL